MLKTKLAAAAVFIAMFPGASVLAADEDSSRFAQAIRAEIQIIKQTYQQRIGELEAKLNEIENKQAKSVAPVSATARRDSKDNNFNPSIGVILNGQYSHFSADKTGIAGFAVGDGGERPRKGFALDHTELNFSANVDDKFWGGATAAIVENDGETEIELEEAFIQTLPGAGLPDGMNIKVGRAFWTLGHLNEHHSHDDDFVDRPLPYRVFLDEAFNEQGAEASYVLPTTLYAEIGGGLFRGDDFPFAKGGSGVRVWSAFARVSDDIADDQSWRLGGYILSGEVKGSRLSNDDLVSFTGDTDLYIVDLGYMWAPTGNAREQQVILQSEYFWRDEDGVYADTGAATGAVSFDDSSSGWYAQAVYQFHPQWRLGARYSQLNAPDVPAGLAGSALDANGHDPIAYGIMLDWTNSEFSRVRLQYNHEELTRAQDDNQVMLQYILSLGAHGAHK